MERDESGGEGKKGMNTHGGPLYDGWERDGGEDARAIGEDASSDFVTTAGARF